MATLFAPLIFGVRVFEAPSTPGDPLRHLAIFGDQQGMKIILFSLASSFLQQGRERKDVQKERCQINY